MITDIQQRIADICADNTPGYTRGCGWSKHVADAIITELGLTEDDYGQRTRWVTKWEPA